MGLIIIKVGNMTLRIGLLTAPIQKSGITPLKNFLEILSPLSELTVITGNSAQLIFQGTKKYSNIRLFLINIKNRRNVFHKIIFNIYTQLCYSYFILKSSKGVDLWLFFLGGGRMVFPMLTARLLKKQVIFCIPGSDSLAAKSSKSILYKPHVILSTLSCMLSNRIILYSPNLIKEWNLEKHRSKIIVAHRHFLDFKTFTITTPLSDRPNRIGYIGRLSAEKGVQNFIQALPSILSDKPKLRILIGGDGPLKDEIKHILKDNEMITRVDLLGWIPHEDLPQYLNTMRLIVLPSYTEGLPNILLEAMACGTPVLATSVGAVPDIIKSDETGIIMENNSPECITKFVIMMLNSSNLDEIAENSRHFVKDNFTFDNVLENWKRVLSNIEAEMTM